MEKSSVTVALDLLSLGSGEDTAESAEKTKERLLTASILQSKTSLWRHKLSDLHALISEAESSPEACAWAFPLLAESIQRSSDAQLKDNCSKWTSTLVHSLQGCKCISTIENVCGALNALLDRVKKSQSAIRDFTSNQLPAVIQGLLWFNGADPLLQHCTMQVAARCLVHFTTATLQFRNHLRKWAQGSLFSEQLLLSQECGRLLVQLCLNSSVQWNSLVQALTTALHWTLTTLYQPVLGNTPSPYVSSTIELPSLPIEEPHRSSLLVLEVAIISQTFCYALKNPPKPASSVAPGINLERVLGIAMFGLSMQQQQAAGHSTEKLLLGVVLPVIHTAIWNIVLVLINACGSFLLPYAVHIESNLVQGMTDLSQELQSDNVSPPLSLAIHRTLVAWVELRKDFETSFFAPVTKALMQFCLLPSSSKDHVEVKMSGLKSLCSLVKTSGPILPHSVAKIISQFPLDSLSPSLPPEEALQLLELLLACVTSGNRSLALPLTTAIHLFTEHCTASNDQQVIDFCRSALAQCSLLQHPSVEPLPPLTSSSPLEGSLVAPPPPAVQPSHYQLRDGRHSRSITPLPVLDVPQPQRELSPVLMETLPSIQLPSLSAKLLPSVSTFGKESDRTKMEIDLTKDEEVPPETKPKINFISTSSNEKSLDEWFASDDPVAMDEEGKNTPVHVAKNATTSSSKNLSSLPATSTAGLHQPSVQDVGNSEAKKGLSDSATTADDAKPSSSGVAAALSSSSSELASKEEKRIVPLRGKNSDSDSDSSVVSGLEFFVDKSPDREIID